MEVPELIKSASETTATTLSHLVGDVKDRIDDVKDRIDTGLHRHAPPPKKHFPVRLVLVLVGAAIVAVMAVARRGDGQRKASEEFNRPAADRAPTPDEARAAERAAQGVDVDRVGRHYEEMTERGANVAGEGQVEPASKN